MAEPRTPVRTSAPESANSDWVSIGRRLVQTRQGLSQPEMAEQLGVHKNTYSRWERGEREIGADALARLAALGWSPLWLLTGTLPERSLQVSEGAPGYVSQEMSGEHLSIAVELADEALGGKWLPRRRYYDLVALIYDALTQGLPYAEIIAFARPAALEMAGGTRDDGGDEVGGEGSGGPGGGEATGDR